MPDWTNYYYSYSTETSTSDEWINISVPSAAQIQQECEEYRRERERKDLMMEQMWFEETERIEEEKQLIKDKERYPLFFWRELCSKQRKENT